MPCGRGGRRLGGGRGGVSPVTAPVLRSRGSLLGHGWEPPHLPVDAGSPRLPVPTAPCRRGVRPRTPGPPHHERPDPCRKKHLSRSPAGSSTDDAVRHVRHRYPPPGGSCRTERCSSSIDSRPFRLDPGLRGSGCLEPCTTAGRTLRCRPRRSARRPSGPAPPDLLRHRWLLALAPLRTRCATFRMPDLDPRRQADRPHRPVPHRRSGPAPLRVTGPERGTQPSADASRCRPACGRGVLVRTA